MSVVTLLDTSLDTLLFVLLNKLDFVVAHSLSVLTVSIGDVGIFEIIFDSGRGIQSQLDS